MTWDDRSLAARIWRTRHRLSWWIDNDQQAGLRHRIACWIEPEPPRCS